MFALAARRMGYRVHTYSPDTDTPTGQVSDVETTAAYEDLEAVHRFARSVDVVTFEFENIPLETTQAVAKLVDVYPSGQVLYTTQHRLREKSFLQSKGFPVTRFQGVQSVHDISQGFHGLEAKGVLKTADFGYDGKGQRLVSSVEDAKDAFAALGSRPAILEAWVDFDCELSAIGARGRDGAIKVYDIFQNHHQNHILDYSISPGYVPDSVKK
jgi:5-(carboxyamino)imidazole ribonucleotide synthase